MKYGDWVSNAIGDLDSWTFNANVNIDKEATRDSFLHLIKTAINSCKIRNEEITYDLLVC